MQDNSSQTRLWFGGVKFSPDGQLMVSWGRINQTITLWQMPDGKHIANLTKHTRLIDGVKFSPDGQLLISWARDKDDIRLWQMPDGKHIANFPCKKYKKAYFSPDGRLLVSWSYDPLAWNWNIEIRLWQMPEGKHLNTLTADEEFWETIYDLTFSPDGRLVVGWSYKTSRLWQMPDGKFLANLTESTYDGQVDSSGATFSPNGQLLMNWKNNSISLWQMPDGKPLTILAGHTYLIEDAIFSPDGQLLVSWSWDTIRLWQMPSGQPIDTFNKYTDGVIDVVFSSDGRLLVSCGNDRMIKLWTSDLPRLGNLPVGRLSEQDREFIQKSLKNKEITQEERYWLEFMQELSNWHRRFDVEVEDAPQLINAGEFDIKIEG
ncbi:WD-40 repeat-containing protein [Stanieria sp. NIES-3757]|nr:WD-40 repeat-containing protein [Stanieria sp. NIES-3757]